MALSSVKLGAPTALFLDRKFPLKAFCATVCQFEELSIAAKIPESLCDPILG